MPDAGSSESSDSRLTEWTTTRQVIDKFDGYVNDLRKYGFTLVTGLLAATGYLSSAPGTAISAGAKLGISVAMLGLIVTLAYLDGAYRSLQRGAIARAIILERSLNLDLTSAISHMAKRPEFGSRRSLLGKVRIQPHRPSTFLYSPFIILYLGLAVSALAIGWSVVGSAPLIQPPWTVVLPASMSLQEVLLGVFAVAVASTMFLGSVTGGDVLDWSVDSRVTSTGDPVKVTFTNLEDLLPGYKLETGCVVRNYAGDDLVYLGTWSVPPFRMRQASWLWDTSGMLPGLYQVIGAWRVVPDTPGALPALSYLAVEEQRGFYLGKNRPDGFEKWKAYTIWVQLVPKDPSAGAPVKLELLSTRC